MTKSNNRSRSRNRSKSRSRSSSRSRRRSSSRSRSRMRKIIRSRSRSRRCPPHTLYPLACGGQSAASSCQSLLWMWRHRGEGEGVKAGDRSEERTGDGPGAETGDGADGAVEAGDGVEEEVEEGAPVRSHYGGQGNKIHPNLWKLVHEASTLNVRRFYDVFGKLRGRLQTFVPMLA